jgi:hypothetical protein
VDMKSELETPSRPLNREILRFTFADVTTLGTIGRDNDEDDLEENMKRRLKIFHSRIH